MVQQERRTKAIRLLTASLISGNVTNNVQPFVTKLEESQATTYSNPPTNGVASISWQKQYGEVCLTDGASFDGQFNV